MGNIGMEGLCSVFAVRDYTRILRVCGGKSEISTSGAACDSEISLTEIS